MDYSLTPQEQQLLCELQKGLPLVTRPFLKLAEVAGMREKDVINRISHWQSSGLLKRIGIIVRHRELGYRANAMVVFDVPDSLVALSAEAILIHEFVTLCYRRPRQGQDWPYNLFCMIHGTDRDVVEKQIQALRETADLLSFPYATLFSTRCFKQRGARYEFLTK